MLKCNQQKPGLTLKQKVYLEDKWGGLLSANGNLYWNLSGKALWRNHKEKTQRSSINYIFSNICIITTYNRKYLVKLTGGNAILMIFIAVHQHNTTTP